MTSNLNCYPFSVKAARRRPCPLHCGPRGGGDHHGFAYETAEVFTGVDIGGGYAWRGAPAAAWFSCHCLHCSLSDCTKLGAYRPWPEVSVKTFVHFPVPR